MRKSPTSAPNRAWAALFTSLGASVAVTWAAWSIDGEFAAGLLLAAQLSLLSQRSSFIWIAAGAALGLSWTHALLLATPPRPLQAIVLSLCLGLGALLSDRFIAREGRRLRVAHSAATCAADLLQRATRQLQALLDSVADPVLLVDPEGRIQAAGSATAATFGRPPSDLVGSSFCELIPDFDPGQLSRASRDDATLASWTGELEARRANAECFACEITWNRITPSETPPAAETPAERLFLFHLRDVSAIRAREIERLHSHTLESIGQLAAGVAHEINTPAQYVSDNLRYLDRLLASASTALQRWRSCADRPGGRDRRPRAEPKTPTPLSESELRSLDALCTRAPEGVREALEGVAHISSIVRAMNSFAHPNKGTSLEAATALDLNRVIDETLAVARSEWKAVATVETCFDPELPALRAIPGEIHQVLLNLIVNAAHAIADRQQQEAGDDRDTAAALGTIVIETRALASAVQIDISDSGTGIPEPLQSRIFDPFFTTKPVGRGTGQGLAITHAIVRRHGGSIECQSRLGQGTRFRVRLPLEPPFESVDTGK